MHRGKRRTCIHKTIVPPKSPGPGISHLGTELSRQTRTVHASACLPRQTAEGSWLRFGVLWFWTSLPLPPEAQIKTIHIINIAQKDRTSAAHGRSSFQEIQKKVQILLGIKEAQIKTMSPISSQIKE